LAIVCLATASHAGGDKLFVDYAGDGVPVVDRLIGEIRLAQVFVAVIRGCPRAPTALRRPHRFAASP